MIQYKEILQEIIEKGTWKEPARPGMPKTISRFSIEKRFNLSDGFPLVTLKETRFSDIVTELIWFLRGDSNIKYLVDNGVNIWNKDAHKFYLRLHKEYTGNDGSLDLDSFIENIKEGRLHRTSLSDPRLGIGYKLGDTGWTYPRMWNNFAGMSINQVNNIVTSIINNPYSRYHVLSAWHPKYIGDLECALPPCHMMVHFNCRPIEFWDRVNLLYKPGAINSSSNLVLVEEEMNDFGIPKFYLDAKMIQRSCDTFLGVPYNIASYALLIHIIAKLTGTAPGEFIWSGNDVHLYEDQVDKARVLLEREPMKLPRLVIGDLYGGDPSFWEEDDFKLVDYKSHPALRSKLHVGK